MVLGPGHFPGPSLVSCALKLLERMRGDTICSPTMDRQEVFSFSQGHFGIQMGTSGATQTRFQLMLRTDILVSLKLILQWKVWPCGKPW